MCIFFTFQHSWTVNFYISHLPLKGKAMATKPRKRIPLRVALLATIIGLICTLSLFGETSQAASSMEAETCEGKGCIECDPSIKQCVPPTPPAPTPEPSTPAPTPSVTPEPPAPTPTPEPPASTPSPEPSPSTTPALGLAKTGASSANLPWITLVLGALGWGAWNKAQQRRV